MPRSSIVAKSRNTLVAIAASLAAAPAFAASVEPASPAPFERVHLVTAFSACEFDPLTTTVTASGGTIRVEIGRQIAAICAPNPPEEPYEIQLGAFPAGSYTVEVVRKPETTPGERVTFEVQPLIHTMQYPPTPHPVADYSGLWWTPAESGWGLSLQQSAFGGALFGALYVFDASRQPRWYTLQGGGWVDATTWQGKVVASNGSPWSAQPYDTGSGSASIVGDAQIVFKRTDGAAGRAQLRYTIDGVTVTKIIARIRF